MRFIFVHDPAAVRGVAVGYNKEMLDASMHACNQTVHLDAWLENPNEYAAQGDVPVFLLLGSKGVLDIMRLCRLNDWPFVLIDHPHAGEQRHQMVRIAANGIYAPYNHKAPIWSGRTYDWKLQPWRVERPKTILHCPSAADFYGQWLERDQTTGITEFEALIDRFQGVGAIDKDWEVVLRTRFESKWAEEHEGAKPGADAAILASGAVADGNSEILLKALRLGTPAFVWQHPGKPLANTLASYAPLTMDKLDDRSVWQIEREPLFKQLAMSQCTLEELADPVMFARLVNWQLENLFN